MPGVDQAPRGLLVPAWRQCDDGRLRAVAVVADVPEAEDCAGLLVVQVAIRRRVGVERAREALLDGALPCREARHASAPRSMKIIEWRRKHLATDLQTASWQEISDRLGVSVATLQSRAQLGIPPGAAVRRGHKHPRSDYVRQWVARYAPPSLRGGTGKAVAEHFGVSYQTLLAWARDGIAPKVGGYRRGRRPQRPLDKLVKTLTVRRANPLAAIMGRIDAARP